MKKYLFYFKKQITLKNIFRKKIFIYNFKKLSLKKYMFA